MKTPYPHQERSVAKLRDTFRSGAHRVILTLPTGSGKTFVAGMLFQLAQQKDKQCLFLAHRRELLFQAKKTFRDDFGLDSGMILAGEQSNAEASIQIASKGTLAARSIRRQLMAMPKVDLLIVDECHLSMAKEFRQVMESVIGKDGYVVGLTATPARKTGKDLGHWWEELLIPVQYQELIKANLLVGTDAYAPYIPDMRGVSSQKWESEGAAKLDDSKLVGDIYVHWQILGEDRATIGFANTVAHSMHLTKLFRSKGVDAEHVDGTTPKDEREAIWENLASGRTQVVWNCNVASEGIDVPRVSAVILAAPTKSLVKYRQRAGRSMRTYPGKTDCLLIDHSGVTLQFGYPDEDWPWELSRNSKKDAGTTADPKPPEMRLCPNCYAMFYGAICPKCGHRRPQRCRDVAVQKGLLRRLKRDVTPGLVKSGRDLSKCWWRAIEIARSRDGQMRMAMGIFKGATGKFPHEVSEVALPFVPGYHDRFTPVNEFVPRKRT